MAIKVTTGQQTFVKKIVVGTPISTAQTGLSIDNFSDFKVATKSEGQILVYDSAESAFKNYDILVGNGLAKEFSPGTDKLLLQIDSDKTPIMTGLTTKGHIVPTADSTFDLGDSAKKFRDLYLSGGTIHLGNIDLKDSSGGFAATDSAGNPVNFNLQGSIPQIRRMFSGGGDLSYDTGTGIFQFDVEQVYTKANFDSDFNVTLDSAALEGVGLKYSNATNTLDIDSSELYSFFKHDDFNDFVADEHVAHSGVSITAGTGLTGGGNIAATRTLNVIGGKGIIANADDIQVDSANIKGMLSVTDAGGDGAMAYDASTGVFTYTGPSPTEVRAHFSAVDAGGDGSFGYDSASGVYTYTGPSAAEVRSHFSAQGDLSYDSTTGVFQFDVEEVYTKANFDSDFNVALDSAVLEGVGLTYNNATNTLSIDSAELSANFRQDIRGYISATDAGGDGSFAYNATTGVFTYTGPSASEVRAHITGGSGIGDSVNGNGVIKIDSAELYSLYRHDDFSDFVADEHVAHSGVSITAGAGLKGGGTIASTRDMAIDSGELYSLYKHDDFDDFVADEHVAHTGVSIVAGKGLTGGGNIASSRTIDIDSANVRGMVSATDAGGDGSFAYNSSTGVFTYTGPSATEVRAHFQALDSSANPTFNQLRGPAEFIIDPAAIGDATGTVKIMGNLQVEGTQTTINSSAIVLKDKNIVIADSATDSSALNGAGFTWGDSAIVSNPTFNYNHANARFVSNREINAPLFSGSGASLTNLPAASLTGTIDSARIPTLLIGDVGDINSIDHDALTNFVANEHIDHTSVSITAGTGLKGGGTIAATRDLAIDSAELYSLYKHDDFSDFVANEHIDHTFVSITAGNGLTGGGTIASTRNLAIDSSQLASLYSKVIVHDNTNGFVANEHIDHTTVSVIAGKGLSGGGTIASNRTIDIDSANVRGMFSGGSGIGDSVNGNGVIKIDSAELYSLYKHDDFADFVADEHVAHTGVSIVAGKGLSGGGNIASSRTIDIDSANIRGMFSAGGDLSYNSGTGQFSFDVESVYTKENFDSDYFLAKDSANTAVERNKHDSTTKNFAVTVASKVAHVYQGQGSSLAYYIDGTESPIVNLKLGRTYRFTLSSSDMSSHPFRFYYDAAKTTQYTTNVTTAATYAEITITEATPPVLHYQCASHGFMGHALEIGTRNLTGFTTTNLTEGTNLYYTDGRFDTRFAAKTTDNLSEGSSNLYYTDARARAVSLDSAEAQAMIDSNFTSGTITFGNNITAPRLRLTATNDASLSSTNHAFQSGPTSGQNIIIDQNEILGRNNGGTNTLNLQTNGGTVRIGDQQAGTILSVRGPVLGEDSATFSGRVTSAGLTISGGSSFAMTNGDITGVNALYFNDPGPGEGIRWTGGNTKLFESPNNLSNAAGNLQVTFSDVRKFTVSDSGVEVVGHLQTDSATLSGLKYPTSDGLNNQVIKTDGAGNLSFVSVAAISGAIDSEAVIALIDSSYVQARVAAGTDSAATQAMIDSNFTNMDIDIHMPDNQQITFGNDSDLKIFHNGNNSFIKDAGTGALILASNYFEVKNAAINETMIVAEQNQGVQLYHNNVKKFETLDSGVNITGNLRVNNAPFTSGSTLTVQEEGSSLSTAATTLNFVGSNVTATGSGATKTITITGSELSVGTMNNVKADAFVGDNSNKTFTLSNAPADSDDVLIFINGILQHTNTYSISGDTVTLDSAPDSASEIEARTHLIQSTNIVLRDHKSYVYTLSTTTDSVSGPDSAGVTLAYDIGKVDVFANGSRLVTGKDFTAGNGTSIVFDSAFSSGNVIEVVSHAKAAVADINGIIAIDSDLTTTGANQIIHTFNATTHRTLKFTAQIEHDSSSSYHAEEVLLTHNGTTVAMTTYAQVLLDSNLGTFDADINSGIVRLKFSPTKTNTSIKLRAIRTTA